MALRIPLAQKAAAYTESWSGSKWLAWTPHSVHHSSSSFLP